jgi:mRNA-degrading endonuclease toxin of MazEF toxin-antitoxin module
VRFGPSIEVQKTRPAAVLSNDTACALLNRVQVITISGQMFQLYPAEDNVTLNCEWRKAMADPDHDDQQAAPAEAVWALVAERWDAVERAVRTQLGL